MEGRTSVFTTQIVIRSALPDDLDFILASSSRLYQLHQTYKGAKYLPREVSFNEKEFIQFF